MKYERVGEKNKNKHGTEMIIIEYNRKDDIIIEFQDEYKYRTKTTYQHFKKGSISNPYDKIIFGVGYIGEGKYSRTYNKNIYSTWYNMLLRCYKHDPKYPTYEDCTVHNDFHCLQNFGKWFEENYYKVPNEIMCLDKDILIKGNKIYGPDSCIIVPQTINSLIVNKYRNGNNNLPLGVCYHRQHGKFMASCSIINNNKNKILALGYFDSADKAFDVYKQFKEKYIKTIADKYKDYIPKKLYDALYSYEV